MRMDARASPTTNSYAFRRTRLHFRDRAVIVQRGGLSQGLDYEAADGTVAGAVRRVRRRMTL
jgi:hypothetical protein